MQVWVQGCPTLYKSQVVLSIKDTPLVPKLCIKSEHDGVLDRAPVVLLPAAHLFESVRRVQCTCRRVGFANLEVDLSGPPTAQHVEHPFHQVASQSPTTARNASSASGVRPVQLTISPRYRTAPSPTASAGVTVEAAASVAIVNKSGATSVSTRPG